MDPLKSRRTVDVGIAQLSMHSVREMCGTDDCDIAYAHFCAFYEVRGLAGPGAHALVEAAV